MANSVFEILNNIANAMGKFVRVDMTQGLTDDQKATARDNIGAGAKIQSITIEEVDENG